MTFLHDFYNGVTRTGEWLQRMAACWADVKSRYVTSNWGVFVHATAKMGTGGRVLQEVVDDADANAALCRRARLV